MHFIIRSSTLRRSVTFIYDVTCVNVLWLATRSGAGTQATILSDQVHICFHWLEKIFWRSFPPCSAPCAPAVCARLLLWSICSFCRIKAETWKIHDHDCHNWIANSNFYCGYYENEYSINIFTPGRMFHLMKVIVAWWIKTGPIQSNNPITLTSNSYLTVTHLRVSNMNNCNC